jgi:3-deoxy-manno-octulosonate cytidylyltransferase (CMP-KDO synthetase)
MTKIVCFIPARYESSRLPGKPLLMINNKPIIQLVYEQVKKCKMINDIYILTDDERIRFKCESFGAKCYIINAECLNGTERIVNFLRLEPTICDIVVNVQGDEPFINHQNIDNCILNYLYQKKHNPNMMCSTLHFKHTNINEISKRSNGKLVLDKHNNILYCSRNIIPGLKKSNYDASVTYYGHIGIFVYDKNYIINEYLDSNTPYQLAEDIEWLKILEDGYKINSVLALNHERGVDTPEDYQYLKDKYEN